MIGNAGSRITMKDTILASSERKVTHKTKTEYYKKGTETQKMHLEIQV